jgi:uncharacterized membrane-anchored protein YitT (DUF2179 family)
MKNKIKDIIVLNLGLLLVSSGFYYFLIPNNLAAGGISGLVIIINKLFNGISIGYLLVVMNIVLFLVGFIFIGLNFGIKTIYSSFAISFMIWIMEYIYPITSPITENILFELFIGILISAIGLALVFNQNASTGGTDIIAKILNKYIHIDIGKALLISDFVIVLMATYVFGLEIGLYCIFALIINGFLIDFIIEYLNICNEVIIVSSAKEQIYEYITKQLNIKSVWYKCENNAINEGQDIIITILSKKQAQELQIYSKKVDPLSEIFINKVYKL